MVWRRNSSASLGSDFNSACGVDGEGELVDDELELSDGGGVDMVAGDKKVLLYDALSCALFGLDARCIGPLSSFSHSNPSHSPGGAPVLLSSTWCVCLPLQPTLVVAFTGCPPFSLTYIFVCGTLTSDQMCMKFLRFTMNNVL